MSSGELINYIRAQLQKGATKDQVTQILLAQGYLPKDIDEAFNLALNPSVDSKFFSPIELSKESWAFYKRGIKTFLALGLIPWIVYFFLILVFAVLLFVILPLFRSGIGKSTCLVLGGILVFPAGLLTSVWTCAALLRAISEEGKIGVKEAYRLSRSNILPLLYVIFLTGIATSAGFFIFIIPGLIFFVWFYFSQLALINEGLQGLKALQKSREYVQGRWWGVLGRIVFISAFSLIISWIPTIIFQYFLKIDLLASAYRLSIPVFLTPFTTIYTYLMYLNLRSLKGELGSASLEKSKSPFYKIFIVGFIILMIFSVLVSAYIFTHKKFLLILVPATKRDELREDNLFLIKKGLDSYFDKHRIYPATFEELESEFFWISPFVQDPKTELPFEYRVKDDGKDYQLCLNFEKDEPAYQCFTSNSSPPSKKILEKFRKRKEVIDEILEFLDSYLITHNKYPDSFTFEDLNKLNIKGEYLLINPETGFYTDGSWFYESVNEGQDYKFCLPVGEGPHSRLLCNSSQGVVQEIKTIPLIPVTP